MLAARTHDEFRNVLHDRCAPNALGDPSPGRHFSNAMVEHASDYPAAMHAELLELGEWLGKLMINEDREALLGFIAERAGIAENMIRRRYKLIERKDFWTGLTGSWRLPSPATGHRKIGGWGTRVTVS